jgi:hypothetical protein
MSLSERKSERIEYVGGDGQQSLFDLSESGISCASSKPRKSGGFVAVKIGDLAVRGKVIYCIERGESYRLGIQFWNLSAEKAGELKNTVERYSKGVPVSCSIADDATGE